MPLQGGGQRASLPHLPLGPDSGQRVDRGDEHDRHHGRVVVPVRAPVGAVGPDEAQHQARHRGQDQRRPQRHEGRGQQDHDQGRQLGPASGGQLADQPGGREVAADRAERAAVAPVQVLTSRAEGGDDHGDGDDQASPQAASSSPAACRR